VFDSQSPAVSGDGRYVAFSSDAGNLVSGDTNSASDVFVRDRTANTTERVSVSSAGTQGNNESGAAVISADGRYVALVSAASNLVAGDSNGKEDVFVRDRLSGTTERVSLGAANAQADDDSGPAAISADGRYVVFVSFAANLVSGDTNLSSDIFVRDRLTNSTQRVSVSSVGIQANDDSTAVAVSTDGRYVAFVSAASNLVSGDGNLSADVFVRDMVALTTVRVSLSSAGAEANDDSLSVALSADGRYVAFASDADNLAVADTNGVTDVFVRDRTANLTELASLSDAGAHGDDESLAPSVSADGRFVAFESLAATLVGGDAPSSADAFLRDRVAATTTRVSVGAANVAAADDSATPALGASGGVLAFVSWAANLVVGDTNGSSDVFVWLGSTPPPTATPTFPSAATVSPTQTPTRTATATPTATLPPAGMPAIGGQIRYARASAPAVASVDVNLSGTAPGAQPSDSLGAYGFANLALGNWTVRPAKTGDNRSAITAIDATFVLQDVVGLRTPGSVERIAGDANGSGQLTAIDATFILQYRVGLIAQLPVARTCASDWMFFPVPANAANQVLSAPLLSPGACQMGAIAYQPLIAAAAAQDFNAIVLGDANASWTPTAGGGADAAAGGATIRFGRARQRRHAPGTPTIIWLPLAIDGPSSLQALELDIEYDPATLAARGVRRLSAVQHTLLAINIVSPGHLRVALASPRPLPLSGRNLLMLQLYGEWPGAQGMRVRQARVDDAPAFAAGVDRGRQ
jgi:Tol biopolymer transport system component